MKNKDFVNLKHLYLNLKLVDRVDFLKQNFSESLLKLSSELPVSHNTPNNKNAVMLWYEFYQNAQQLVEVSFEND
jgi:hypothetical protein